MLINACDVGVFSEYVLTYFYVYQQRILDFLSVPNISKLHYICQGPYKYIL